MGKRKRIVKEPVRIRSKELKDGTQSLYLDIYQNGRRSYEFLKLYLQPGTDRSTLLRNKETLRLAEAVKSQRIVDVAEGNTGVIDYGRKSRILLKDWLEHIYYEKLKNGQSGSNALTVNNLRLHIIKYKGEDSRLCDVDKKFLLGFIDYLSDADSVGIIKKKISQSTAHLYFNTFNTALNEAVRDDYLPSNPIAKLKREDKKPVAATESTRVFLTVEEVESLKETPCLNGMVKRAFLFSCYSGLRISDIEDLKWSEIKKDGDRRYISKKMIKTHGVVTIPLPHKALEWLPSRKESPDGIHVFDMPKFSTVNSDVKKWAKDAGITKTISFHVSRHTYATTLLTLGGDLYTTSRLLGHKDIRVTQIYAKIVDKKKIAAVDLFDKEE
ncbi:site-specific integrase [uncultured Prevotella sp.]|uniref:site-specific integrase n=1 Tax=uncultured Prevotella sp. TaxID=159272 RepID=UPI0025945FD4|nr:site-specific integrase [uncultured Prevotella sp.]